MRRIKQILLHLLVIQFVLDAVYGALSHKLTFEGFPVDDGGKSEYETALKKCARIAFKTWPKAPFGKVVRIRMSLVNNMPLPNLATTQMFSVVVDDAEYSSAMALSKYTNLDPRPPGSYDIEIKFNDKASWHLKADDSPVPNNMLDMVTVCLHEMHHSLLHGSRYGVKPFNILHTIVAPVGWRGRFHHPTYNSRYEQLVAFYTTSYKLCPLLMYRNDPKNMGRAITGNNLYFMGSPSPGKKHEIVTHLHAPNLYKDGQSIYHWHEKYKRSDDRLMCPLGTRGIHSKHRVVSEKLKKMRDALFSDYVFPRDPIHCHDGVKPLYTFDLNTPQPSGSFPASANNNMQFVEISAIELPKEDSNQAYFKQDEL